MVCAVHAAMSTNGIITGLPTEASALGRLNPSGHSGYSGTHNRIPCFKNQAVKNTPSFTDNIDSYAADSVSLCISWGL